MMSAKGSSPSTETCTMTAAAAATAAEYAATASYTTTFHPAQVPLQSSPSNINTLSAACPFSRKRSASEDLKAKTAATARRKRRRALVRRTHSPKTLVRSTNQATAGSSQSQRPSFATRHDPDNTLVTTIQPTVQGVQQEVPRRLLANERVAVPTECTYEACFRFSYKNSAAVLETSAAAATADSTSTSSAGPPQQQQQPHPLSAPHVYVPASLESPFLQHYLQPHKYGNRQEGKTTPQVCSFSETYQILTRLAAKLWPGPVVFLVTTDKPVAAALVHSYQGRDYVALRSPCHPLAVKVCQEYERCDDQDTDADAANAHASVLVGRPLQLATTNDYITSAVNAVDSCGAGMIDCVLNGEERREIFAVPTCEYERPWPVKVYVNHDDRQITLVGNSNNSQSATTATQPCCEANVLHSIRARFCPKPTRSKMTPKAIFRERMVHTVLHKWTVTEAAADA